MRSVFSPSDLTHADRSFILRRAKELKASASPLPSRELRVGALFFNPSLRTRVSFEQAAAFIGGSCQTLNAGADLWKMELDPQAVMDQDTVENVAEAAGVLGRFFHILGVRAFPTSSDWAAEREEPLLRAFARHSGISVVSLEGAMHHPCQGLADWLTMTDEFGEDLTGLPITLTWAWHPKALPMAVPNSFALQAVLAGCDLRIAHPPGYDLDPELMNEIHATGASVRVCHSQAEALEGAKVVYTKSWGAAGQTAPHDPALRSWITDEAAWSATDQAKIMHCLPVRRNVEISSALLDGPFSRVLDEAENRLWGQAALLDLLAREAGL